MEDYKAVCQNHLAQPEPPHPPSEKSVSPNETQPLCGSLLISHPARDRARPTSRPFWLVKF